MPRDSSSAIRARENSRLFVRCVDANGTTFCEQTETIDISETGISFFLNTPIWVDTHVTIEIVSSSLFGSRHTVRAKVVWIKVGPSGRQLVGARFDE
jgi:hypothetical protein